MPEIHVDPKALDEVILALHQGVFERPHWTGFLEKIRQITGANYASLVFSRSDARSGDVTVIRSGGDGSEVETPNLGSLATRLKVPYDALEANRPYTLTEIVDAEDDQTRHYTIYLQNRQINDAIVIRVGGADQGNGWLTLGRSQSPFAGWTARLLTQIAPHLSTAVQTLSELERAQIRAEIAHDAVQRLNFGWVTFDARGCMVEIDPVAERLFLGTSRLKPCARGKPFPIGLSGQRHDLRDILAEFGEKPNARARAMHLVDEPWLDMLLVPITYRSLSGGRTPVAVGLCPRGFGHQRRPLRTVEKAVWPHHQRGPPCHCHEPGQDHHRGRRRTQPHHRNRAQLFQTHLCQNRHARSGRSRAHPAGQRRRAHLA